MSSICLRTNKPTMILLLRSFSLVALVHKKRTQFTLHACFLWYEGVLGSWHLKDLWLKKITSSSPFLYQTCLGGYTHSQVKYSSKQNGCFIPVARHLFYYGLYNQSYTVTSVCVLQHILQVQVPAPTFPQGSLNCSPTLFLCRAIVTEL